MRRVALSVGRRRAGLNLVLVAVGVAGLGTLASPSRTLAETPEVHAASTASRTSSCVECHRFSSVLSHPTGVRPSMKIPEDLPLVGGEIACVTCHDASADHGSTHTKVGVRRGGNGLCSRCHAASDGFGHASAGGMLAHLRSDSVGSRFMDGVDAESSSCLSCHDGAMASGGEVHALGVGASNTHPMGPRARLDSSMATEGRLVDPSSLDGRVRLFGKAVGCGSCHSVYARSANMLVMSNLRSRLCLSCHVE